MTAEITQELKARGVAQVIVVMKATLASAISFAAAPSAAETEPLVRSLTPHFTSSEKSQVSALATAAATGHPLRPSQKAGQAHAPAVADQAVPLVRFYPNLGVMLGTVDRQGLAALRSDPNVASVTGTPPISLIKPERVAAARLRQKVTWGLKAMRIPELWELGYTGKGILVGHLDTGVDGKHPALKKAIARFAEFDYLGREVKPSPKPYDTDDHGTHTAAIIAGRPVVGRHVGVAPGAKLASAIVIEGGNVVARVLGGMDWAIGQGVRILSMSLGLRGWWEDFLPVTQILRARNILPVFAVGNEGPGTSRSPGNYSEALSVGAHDRKRRVADFSSSQNFTRSSDSIVPDLVGPGVDIISARPGGGYQLMDGTSMATPHIAGLAALLMEARPTNTADEIEAAIFKSCRLVPGMTVDRGNRGIPDAIQALALL
jgi:subtilisin family serine protease